MPRTKLQPTLGHADLSNVTVVITSASRVHITWRNFVVGFSDGLAWRLDDNHGQLYHKHASAKLWNCTPQTPRPLLPSRLLGSVKDIMLRHALAEFLVEAWVQGSQAFHLALWFNDFGNWTSGFYARCAWAEFLLCV